jgi:hypothetical protein
MFWQEEYYNGSLVRITIIVTYSNWSIPFTSIIYLFLKPTMWGISPRYNYSIPYTSSWRVWDSCYGPPFLKGDTILPQSSTPYIVVWWVPLLQVGVSLYGTTGQWDVMIASNTNSSNPCSYLSYTGIGTGYFKPKPGDWIKITVTYDPSTNTLSGIAVDLNHMGWETSATTTTTPITTYLTVTTTPSKNTHNGLSLSITVQPNHADAERDCPLGLSMPGASRYPSHGHR